MKKSHNKNNGITLVALVVTIIILLILAGISIASLTGNGLFEKAKLAKEKQEDAQIKEETTLADYENKVGEYVDSTREQITVDKEEYEQLKKDVASLKQNMNTLEGNELWTGTQSSGVISLSDSIYNYNYLIFTCNIDGTSAIVNVNKDGMSKIRGGSGSSATTTNSAFYWGFYISEISSDGKTLTLTRSGYEGSSTSWSSISIKKIVGI